MAMLFDSIPLNGITPADLSQLLSYIEHREIDMWYYGNKEQFVIFYDFFLVFFSRFFPSVPNKYGQTLHVLYQPPLCWSK